MQLIFGWKYEKSEKSFDIALRINVWVYVSLLSLFYEYSLLYRVMKKKFYFFVYLCFELNSIVLGNEKVIFF